MKNKLINYFLYIIFFIYIHFVIYSQILIYNPEYFFDLKYLLIAVPLSILLEFLIIKFFPKIMSKINLSGDNDIKKAKIYTLVAAIIIFIAILIQYYIYYPGGVLVDTTWEYCMAIGANRLSDWHTLLHVLIFFRIPTLIAHSYALVVFFQICLYTISLTYLFNVLYRCNLKKVILILFFIFILSNPITYLVVLCPYKDSSFNVLVILLLSMFIDKFFHPNLYNRSVTLIFASLIAVISLMIKRNGILTILPLILVYLVIFDKNKKNILVFTISFFIFYIGLTIFCESLDYEKLYNYNVEPMGVPLTVILNNIRNNPNYKYDKVIDDSFNASYPGTDKTLKEVLDENYNLGYGFDSVKHDFFNCDILNKKSKSFYIKLMLDAFKNDFKSATKAFFNQINDVLAIENDCNYYMLFANEFPDDVPSLKYTIKEDLIYKVEDEKSNVFNYPKMITFSLGFINFLMVCFFVTGVINKKKYSLYTLPIILYSFGTMLLLSGYEFRYFSHIYFIALPLFYVIMCGLKKEENNI